MNPLSTAAGDALGADSVNPIEIIAALLGLANVTLVARRSIWNYPFGIAMVALYAVVFAEAKLYSDAILQIFFLVVQIYGWWNWARSRADAGEVAVRRLGWPARGAWIASALAATALWGWMMHAMTDASFPWWDASVLMLSVAGQLLMSWRFLENWLFWIVVDIVSVGLYAAKGLYPTTALYVVFLGLSVWGLLAWRRARPA